MIFHSFEDYQRELFAATMFRCKVTEGVNVINENDDAYSFFILMKGNMHVFVGGKLMREIGPGASFGDIALLYNSKRTATITAVSHCELFGIGRDQYREMVMEIQNKE